MTILFSKGLPRSVSQVAPGFQRWGGTNVSQFSDRYRSMAYEEIYRRQPGVYAVVNRLLEGICRIPIKVYQFGPDGSSRSRVRAKRHARRTELLVSPALGLANLMSEPWAGHAQWELKERLGFDLLVHGKCLAWKLRAEPGAPPVEIWPIPWWCVTPIADARGVQAFMLQLDGTTYLIPPEDAVYMELVGHGISPLEPLRRSIGIEDKAMDWQVEALEGGLSARAVFSTKVNVNDKKTMRALREEIEQLYSGPSGKQFAVLGPDSDVKPVAGISAVDVSLITARQSSREDTCSCYAVSTDVMGFSTTEGKASTYASAVERRRSFYTDGIGPKVTLFEELLDMRLVKSEPLWADAFVKFDMTELLRPDPESLARADLMDMQSGTTASNERRTARQLKPWGDPDDPDNPANQPWIAGNGQPIGAAVENAINGGQPPKQGTE